MGKRLLEIVLRAPTETDEGRVVEMLEMGTAELFQAEATVRKGAGDLETKVEYLRYCIVKDGKQKLDWGMLQGSKAWDERFSVAETLSLCMIWNQIHEPSTEEVGSLGGSWRVKSGT